jgi:hypothetical protein
MGTLIGNPAKRASFQTQLFPAGLDLNRCEIHRALGVWKAADGASFRAGQPVMLNASGEVVVGNQTATLGVAKWDKITQKTTVVVDEVVLFGTAGATKNLKPNMLSNVTTQVRSAAAFGGTLYAITDDYTLNLVNGTITHVVAGSGGTIVPTAPVYVTYTRTLTEADLLLEGKNFWASLDYVSVQDGRIAVIQAPAQIFTTVFDTSQVYALTGEKSNIYVNAAGLFSTVLTSSKLVGRVISVPSASDPFLGIDFHGTVEANS